MFTTSVRVSLLLFVAALGVSVGSGQPPVGQPLVPKKDLLYGVRPSYTAFPSLNARTREEADKAFETPPLPAIAADAPTLRKIQFEQLQEGLAYIIRIEERMRVGAYSPDEFLDLIQMTTRVYRVAAEMEGTAAKRVPWHEAVVRRLKEGERFIEKRMEIGTDPPQRLHQVRFERLQAEADLFKLKIEAAAPCQK